MKFDVVVGNVAPIFKKREQYERFIRGMHQMGWIVRFMSPEQWVSAFSQIEEYVAYVELKYTLAYDSEYITDQLEQLIDNIEYRREEDDEALEIDMKDMMVAMTKQLIVLSQKIEDLSEHVETLDNQVGCDEGYLAEQILEGLPDLSIDWENLAEEVAEKLKQSYIDDITELLQEKYKLGGRHSKAK